VAGPRQIVLEFDIEQPMHALDPPMTARAPGDAFDIERRGRDIVVGIEAAAIGIFGAGVNLRDGIDVLEARLARVASLRCYPVDLAGGGVSAPGPQPFRRKRRRGVKGNPLPGAGFLRRSPSMPYSSGG
jgi:hypothetical protein